MKSIDKYFEASLDFESAESEFKKELCEILEIPLINIVDVQIVIDKTCLSHIKHYIRITLRGVNRLKSENVNKINGLTIITPKHLEIEYMDVPL